MLQNIHDDEPSELEEEKKSDSQPEKVPKWKQRSPENVVVNALF